MFTLTDDERAIRDTARDFAAEHLAPNAVEWDQNKHFPVDVLRKAGGARPGRHLRPRGRRRIGAAPPRRRPRSSRSSPRADPSIAAYISIHNMVTWMIDTFGDDEQRAPLGARTWRSMEQLGSYCLTEPGAGSDAAALEHHGGARRRRLRAQRRQAVHLRRRHLRRLRRDGPHRRRRRPRASRRSSSRRTRRACPSAPTRRRWAGTRSPPAR